MPTTSGMSRCSSTRRDIPSRGIAFSTVIDGLHRAIVDAGQKLGVQASLIMCFLRHLDEADAERDAWMPRWRSRTASSASVSDSSEAGHPPSKFKHVFRRARDAGFFLTAHAGEEGPPGYVWEALDVLGVARIDHGIRSLEDADAGRAARPRAGPADRVPAFKSAAAGCR